MPAPTDTTAATAPVLIAGEWRDADASSTFAATNPATGEALPGVFPVSRWSDLDAALDAADGAFEQLQELPAEKIAAFLDRYADKIDADNEELAKLGEAETALPAATRLGKVEIPRTSNQLRLCAKAARLGEWAMPTLDTGANIRSMHVAIGPVVVFGPNNFPFAFNGISGGDFAAAIASGNPVIAKGHPLHPGTTRRLGELAKQALEETGLPAATVQLLYHFDNDDGLKLVADPRVGATAFTGSRKGGLALKAAADAAGKPAYLEMSSVNPVVLLPSALDQKADDLAAEYATSCLMGVGQFCTNPGLVFVVKGEPADAFLDGVKAKFEAAEPGTLFADSGVKSLGGGVDTLARSGATVVTGGEAAGGCRYANTLLRATGDAFLKAPADLQTEAFGNAGLVVVCDSVDQIAACLRHLEGNLTGCIYSGEGDDADYATVEKPLRRRVGRLLNDKMPTGVAVSPAMVHGGPYPSTGHGGFTAVGPPASLRRFSLLRCYDHVAPSRLPPLLRDDNPGDGFRYVEGQWTK